jgi:transcriptional regulator with XRE-family HTH domain
MREVRIDIGKRLKQLRKSLELKIIEVSEKLGFSNHQTLIDIEEGKREVKAKELFKFSKVYYCNIDDILNYTKEREKEVEYERSKV